MRQMNVMGSIQQLTNDFAVLAFKVFMSILEDINIRP